MKEENKTEQDEVILAIKDEYEKQIAGIKEEYKIKMKEQEEKHIKQLRAIMSGRQTDEELSPPKEPSLEETIYDGLRKKYFRK